jgi:hypothetical protein
VFVCVCVVDMVARLVCFVLTSENGGHIALHNNTLHVRRLRLEGECACIRVVVVFGGRCCAEQGKGCSDIPICSDHFGDDGEALGHQGRR